MTLKSCLTLVFMCAICAAPQGLSRAAEEGIAVAPAMGPDCSRGDDRLQPLARITNTRDESYHCLGADLDARSNITGLRFETHQADSEAAHGEAPRAVRVREFTSDDIASRQGVVLDGTPDHAAILLRGRLPSGSPSASLAVDYLYNGLTGTFRSCTITLRQVAADGRRWKLLDANGREVRDIVVRTRALPLVGTIGIETIEGVCLGA